MSHRSKASKAGIALIGALIGGACLPIGAAQAQERIDAAAMRARLEAFRQAQHRNDPPDPGAQARSQSGREAGEAGDGSGGASDGDDAADSRSRTADQGEPADRPQTGATGSDDARGGSGKGNPTGGASKSDAARGDTGAAPRGPGASPDDRAAGPADPAAPSTPQLAPQRANAAIIKARLEAFRRLKQQKALEKAGIDPNSSGATPGISSEPGPPSAVPRAPAFRPPSQPFTVTGYVGLVLHTRGGVAFVKRVVSGWPAAEAGLKPGDQLVEVGGVLAQAPRLDEALDRLSGRPGESVLVVVHRPGEPGALSLKVTRTSRPTPEVATARIPSLPGRASSFKPLDDAIDQWTRGDRTVLERVLNLAAHDRPEQGAEAYQHVVKALMELEGDDTQAEAIRRARQASELFPLVPVTPDIVRLAFPQGTPRGADMRRIAEQALITLKKPPQGVSDEQLEEARQRWEVVGALGWLRMGRTGKGLRQLDRALQTDPVDLVALRADGTPLWQASAHPAPGWQDLVDASLSEGDARRAWKGVNAVLNLDEPAWVYPAMVELDRSSSLQVNRDRLEPRWPLVRTQSELASRRLETVDGVKSSLREIQAGRPAVILRCAADFVGCDGWRLALSSMRDGGPLAGALVGMVVDGPLKEPASNLAWPTWVLSSPSSESGAAPPAKGASTASASISSETSLQVLDPGGFLVARYGEYEPGLEQRIVDQVAEVLKDPSSGGPYLAQGGVNLASWELRWSRRPPLSGVDWSRPGHPPRLWLLTPPDRMEVLEAGRVRRGLEELTGPDRIVVAELDGDPTDEQLVYRQGDGMLEALDGSGTPRWIVPRDAAIDLVLARDIDADGRDEVLVTYEGEEVLHCYASDGSKRWATRIPGGVQSIAVGKIKVGESVAVASHNGRLHLLSPTGELRRELEPGFRVARVALADLDGDGKDEIIVGNSLVTQLVAPRLRVDEPPRVVALAGDRQMLVYGADGRLKSRMTLEGERTAISVGDFEGDKHQEIMLQSARGGVSVLGWQESASTVSEGAGDEKKLWWPWSWIAAIRGE